MDRIDWSRGTGDSKTLEESEIVALPFQWKCGNELFCDLNKLKPVEVWLKKSQYYV